MNPIFASIESSVVRSNESLEPQNFEKQNSKVSTVESSSDAAAKLCPDCNGSLFWIPVLCDASAIRCMNCKPPISKAMIGSTLDVLQAVDPEMSELGLVTQIEPVIVACGVPVCASCGSAWVEFSNEGYRCGGPRCGKSIDAGVALEAIWGKAG